MHSTVLLTCDGFLQYFISSSRSKILLFNKNQWCCYMSHEGPRAAFFFYPKLVTRWFHTPGFIHLLIYKRESPTVTNQNICCTVFISTHSHAGLTVAVQSHVLLTHALISRNNQAMIRLCVCFMMLC